MQNFSINIRVKIKQLILYREELTYYELETNFKKYTLNIFLVIFH